MWWLILCVNLTGSWGAQISGQVLFWACLWRYSWMRLTFKWVNWRKQLSFLMWVSLMQSGEMLNRLKKPKLRDNLSCLITSELEHQFFLASRLYLKCWLFQCLEPESWAWKYIISSPGSQVFGHGLELNLWLSQALSCWLILQIFRNCQLP